MKRKTLGVCVTGYDWECESRVIAGLVAKCRERGHNLLIFAPTNKRPSLNTNQSISDDTIKGEHEIFNLINYETLDGLLLFGDSFMTPEIVYNIARRAELSGVPVMNINDQEHPIAHNIVLSDKRAMEFVVEHLINEHGCREFAFSTASRIIFSPMSALPHLKRYCPSIILTSTPSSCITVNSG